MGMILLCPTVLICLLRFSLDYAILGLIGVHRRNLRQYLTYFKNTGLLKFTIKKGATPFIELFFVPRINHSINTKNSKQYIIPSETGGKKTGQNFKRTSSQNESI